MHRGATGVVAAALALAACGRPPAYIAVRGGEIRAHLEAMRRDGEASLETVIVSGKGWRPADVEVVFFHQTVRIGKTTTSIDKLAAGCDVGAGACALDRYRDTPIKLREVPIGPRAPGKPNPAPPIIAGGLSLAAAGGAVYCAVSCESNTGIKTMGLGLAALLGGLVTYVLAGGTIRD